LCGRALYRSDRKVIMRPLEVAGKVDRGFSWLEVVARTVENLVWRMELPTFWCLVIESRGVPDHPSSTSSASSTA
jgi:hypothetical protein